MVDKLIKESFYAYKEIKDNEIDQAEHRWLNKKVDEYQVIYDGSTIDNVTLSNSNQEYKAKMSLSENYVRGKSSLLLEANTMIENIFPRPTFNLRIDFPKQNFSKYNRVSAWIYIESTGYQNFYFHFRFGNQGHEVLHAPSLIPNKMNHVTWEIDKVKRDEIERISITPYLMGCPPEALPEVKFYISEIRLEKVEGEYELGWDLENRLAYSHPGYYINGQKEVIGQNINSNTFHIYSGEILEYIGNVETLISQLGKYQVMDFTDFKKPGKYILKVDNRQTNEFVIDNNPYLSSVWKSINFLRMLRCGEDVAEVHSACHLNCKTINKDGKTVPNFGGWHDAGDVSQFEICTAEMAHAIIDLGFRVKDKDPMLAERLFSEAKVGISWLLRTRFGDGDRAMAVTYSIWRDNVLSDDNKTIFTNPAENGPFENFLAAAAEAVAYNAYKESDPNFAEWSLRAAKEDFEFAKVGYEQGIYTRRWGPSIPVQTSGAGAIAASILYTITKDKYYEEIATKYGDIILSCQQQDYPNWDIPIRGFFYEDPQHQFILSYEHRGHEQTPVHALGLLYETFKNNKKSKSWLKGLELYREYIMETIKYTKPYNLIPAHVYDLNKINIEHFTVPTYYGDKEKALNDLRNQIRAGIKLSETAYLRIFPIAVTRRGFHATQLSKTKGVSVIARIFNDDDLKNIVINQIEWILGKNPFASSTMYGEGYNYHPLYVAFSKQIVGSLPVGFKTYGNYDLPYWPTINNAVYKEIWGHTTGKYLWVLADL